MQDFDGVGQPLSYIIQRLDTAKKHYNICITRPIRDTFKVDTNSLYVIRQQQSNDTYHLIAAAKMGKEVF